MTKDFSDFMQDLRKVAKKTPYCLAFNERQRQSILKSFEDAAEDDPLLVLQWISAWLSASPKNANGN